MKSGFRTRILRLIFLITGALYFSSCASVQIRPIGNEGILINNKIGIYLSEIKKIWLKSQEISGVGTSDMPEIYFLEYDYNSQYPHYGMCWPAENKIEIYIGELIYTFDDLEEIKEKILYTIAHEFLHRLYYLKYFLHRQPKSNKNDHCVMAQSGDFKKITDYIRKDIFNKEKSAVQDFKLEIVSWACNENR